MFLKLEEEGEVDLEEFCEWLDLMEKIDRIENFVKTRWDYEILEI